MSQEIDEATQQAFQQKCDGIWKRATEGLGLKETDVDYHIIYDYMRKEGNPDKADAKVKAIEASRKEKSEGKAGSEEEAEEPSGTEIDFAEQEAKDKKTQAEIDKRYEYIREKFIKDPTDPKVKQEWAYLNNLRSR